jgi:preprotein translocase subunit SecG
VIVAFALLVILYVFVCIFLIIVVLFQQGKGADLAGAFGGGGSSTNFGPRSRTNYLHWVTTCSFVLFVVLSMSLAIIQGNRGGSVLEKAPPAQETAEQAPGPADMVPGEAREAPAEPVPAVPQTAPETGATEDAAPSSQRPADSTDEPPRSQD